MVSRKRDRQEMEADTPSTEPTMLQKIRNMWEFASLMQYIFIFGKAVKVDEDLDIEELETECLKPTHSDKLSKLGLALLKFVSSHKPLTLEIFDEYARRQYVAKAPQRNPFGIDEEPKKFAEFDVFTKIRVLQQLSTWTLGNAERIRERMPEKDSEQTQWRIEPFGWDADDRLYFLLDDDRLYRRTDPPLPPPTPKSKPKANTKKAKAARAAKRRKLSSRVVESSTEEEEDIPAENVTSDNANDGFGGMKWECLAVTLEDYQSFLESIRRSRDPNEKVLHKRLTDDVLPVIEKRAEEQQRKELRKLRELENLQKLATAKRSSRLADKMEKQREMEQAAEAERKRQADLAMARKEQARQQKMEQARESRMMTREQRLKEREVKRILHEEELARLEEDSKKIDANEARLSERHLKAEMQKRQKELEKLAQEDEWVFDCSVCGMHGENLDDGSHSIACEKCNVWQHSACHNIKKEDAERDDFHFLCNDCKRRAQIASQPKIPPLKIRLGASSSPREEKNRGSGTITVKNHLLSNPPNAAMSPPRSLQAVQINVKPRTDPGQRPTTPASVMNGPSLSPQGQSPGPPGSFRMNGVHHLSPPTQMTRPDSSGIASRPITANGTAFPPLARWEQPNGHNATLTNYAPQTNGSHVGLGVTLPHPQIHPSAHQPYFNSFERQRPSSVHSSQAFPSPVKHTVSSSPPQPNGHGTPLGFPPFASPNASFPPVTSQQASYSPIKQDSSPLQQSFSPPQVHAGMLPGYSPAKQTSPRPASSHSVSETPVFPPVTTLSPSSRPQVMEPPSKKMTPERPTAQVNGCSMDTS